MELDSEPLRVAAHALPQTDTVLPNARREHDGIQPTERRGQRTQLAADR